MQDIFALLDLEYEWVFMSNAKANLIHSHDEFEYPDPILHLAKTSGCEVKSSLRELNVEPEGPLRLTTLLIDIV